MHVLGTPEGPLEISFCMVQLNKIYESVYIKQHHCEASVENRPEGINNFWTFI